MLSLIKKWSRRIRRRLLGEDLSAMKSRLGRLEVAVSRLADESERQRRDLRILLRHVIRRDPPPMAPIRKDGFRHDEVFLLGSSPSMLELTSSEKATIQAGISIAMNRYLVFWEMIGIWPTYFFLADSRGVGRRVFEESINLIRNQRPDASPILLLESDFEAAVPGDLPAVFFHRDDRNGNQHEFADSLNDPLYFHRGSLTSLLNLVSVLRIAPRIRLVGVDLNRPGTFFESTRNEVGGAKFFNPWDEHAKSQGVHATVANMEKAGWGSGTMLDEFDTLVGYLADRGITITSASPDSLLVEKRLCAFDALSAPEAARDTTGLHRHSTGCSP